MSRIDIWCYNAAGTTRISTLKLSGARIGSATDEIVVRVKNVGPAASAVLLGAIRADFLATAPAGEDPAVTNERGGELADEKWIEARLSALDAWTPIGEAPEDSLDLGPIASGGIVDVSLRLNTPADADTSFDVYFSLAFRAVPA